MGANALWLPEYNPKGHTEMIERVVQDNEGAVTEYLVHHPDERALRGAKQGLKPEYRKMSHRELHDLFGHISPLPPGETCQICKEVKGTTRYIRHTVDPHKETRVAHTFCGDLLTLSSRSRQGARYVIVLKDLWV